MPSSPMMTPTPDPHPPRAGRPLRYALAASMLVLGLTGCMSLAPDHVRPELPLPRGQFPLPPAASETQGAQQGSAASGTPSSGTPASGTASPTPADASSARSAWEIGWDEYFSDERLKGLIRLALDNNRDLRVAALNIDRARAMYQIQDAGLYPQVGAGISSTRQRTLSQTTGQPVVMGVHTATVGITSWELDFFGRVRNLSEQALQQYYGTFEARRSAQIALIAEVANAYIALAADQEQRSLARRTLESQNTSLKLVRRSVELGAASALDQRQIETAVQTARGDLARYNSMIQKDRNALAFLVGGNVPPELMPDDNVRLVTAIRELPPGVPSEVLTRRPDVLLAEHQLASASASIGAARAALFPSITLTAAGGLASPSLTDLFSDGIRIWSFAPKLNIPIFTAGALQANLEATKIAQQIAVANYEKTVQGAFREVSDALADRETLGERLDAQRALVEAASSTYELSEARYRNGADSYLNALVAQRTLYAAQQAQISLRQVNALNLVTLYKTLGGGWKDSSVNADPITKTSDRGRLEAGPAR